MHWICCMTAAIFCKKDEMEIIIISQVAEERISNIRTVRAFAQEMKESKR